MTRRLGERSTTAGDGPRAALAATLAAATATGIAGLRRDAAHAAVTAERRRVARDLHDGVAQELAYLRLQTGRLEASPAAPGAAARVARAADRALAESRATIAELSRPTDGSLRCALLNAAGPLAESAGARLTVTAAPGVEPAPQVVRALTRIAREATANALRHGGAAHVRIAVDVNAHGGLRLRIRDDGIGFDLGAARDDEAFGLTGMRERAESIGAHLRIVSAPGHGTEVEVAR